MSKGNKQLLVKSNDSLNLNTDLDVVNLLEVSRFSLPAFCDMIQQRFGKKGVEIIKALGQDFLRKSFK